MRLFHVSEESDIHFFEPRLPVRKDLDQSVGLVWAIDEDHLPNFLTPRDCPRVAYHFSAGTTEFDRKKYFSSASIRYGIAIEKKWFYRMLDTSLYLYEFDSSDFTQLDPVAGYYVSQKTQYPVAKYVVDDLFGELFKRNVEIRIVDCLWDLADEIKASTLSWSLCRIRNASPRRE